MTQAKRAFLLFPGQGAQHVGMCADSAERVPAIRRMFESASEIVGYDLRRTCAEGPEVLLHSTSVSQPAIYVASWAAAHLLEKELESPLLDTVDAACGLSLGEYSALAVARAISFEDGVRLVHARGQAMESSLKSAPSSTMVNVTRLEEGEVVALCEKAQEASGERVAIANFLHARSYSLSGGCLACEAVRNLAGEMGAGQAQVTPLMVGGAFHSEFVQSAEDPLREALDSITICSPQVPVLSNVNATVHTNPENIRQMLVRQLTAPVQWEATMRELLGQPGAEDRVWYELGPGRVLSAVLKRISRRAAVSAVGCS